MDTSKVRALITFVDAIKDITFEVDDDNQVKMKARYSNGLKFTDKAMAQRFAGSLNAAMAPVIEKAETDIRKQLVLMSKVS